MPTKLRTDNATIWDPVDNAYIDIDTKFAKLADNETVTGQWTLQDLLTFAPQGVGTIYATDPSAVDPDASAWAFTVARNNFSGAQTRYDVIHDLGYNLQAGGTRLDLTDHAFGFQFESYYEVSGFAGWELFVRSFDVNGNSCRPIFFRGPVDTASGEFSTEITANYINFKDWVGPSWTDTTQMMKVDWSAGTISLYDAGAGVGLSQFKNGLQWLQQHNAAGTAFISLIYADANDRVIVGAASYGVEMYGTNFGIRDEGHSYTTHASLGIGTSNPHAALHIQEDYQRLLLLERPASSQKYGLFLRSGYFCVEDDAGGEFLRIDDGAVDQGLRVGTAGVTVGDWAAASEALHISGRVFLKGMAAASTPTGGGTLWTDTTGNLQYTSPGGTTTQLAAN